MARREKTNARYDAYLIDGVEARIVDEEEHPVADGKSGEFQVRGPNVMKGYYRAPDLNRPGIRGGCLV